MNDAWDIGWCGPTHDAWGWLLSHFQSITQVTPNALLQGCRSDTTPSDVGPRKLLIAIEHRRDAAFLSECLSDPDVLASRTLAGQRFCILLGADWHGHRRTFPLPDAIPVFYWYQWYDQILPWLMCQPESVPAAKSSRKTKQPKSPSESLAPRIQRILELAAVCSSAANLEGPQPGMAWVLTDNLVQGQMWQDVLEGRGYQVASSRIDESAPWLTPQLVVIDAVSRSNGTCDLDRGQASHEGAGNLRKSVEQIRRMHPNAFLAVVEPFPTWERWSDWHAIGVDAVVPRPASIDGLLMFVRSWTQCVRT